MPTCLLETVRNQACGEPVENHPADPAISALAGRNPRFVVAGESPCLTERWLSGTRISLVISAHTSAK